MSESDESDDEIRELKRRFDEKILSVLRTNHLSCRLKMRRSELRETSAKNKTPVRILR